MAGAQLARSRAPETMDEFVARREVAQVHREANYAAGREKWSASTRTGQNYSAARPSDVVALGAQARSAASNPSMRSPAAAPAPSRAQTGGTRYGALYAPPPDDLTELRRQQAEFKATRRKIADQNSWMAAPALGPVALALGLGAPAWMAGLAGPTARQAPLVLQKGLTLPRGGDSPAAAAGRRAHEALKERVNAKPGWVADRGVKTEAGVLRPDVRAPARNPAKPETRYQMELKPNTPSGRRAAAKAVKRYSRETNNKTRAIFYEPKDFK